MVLYCSEIEESQQHARFSKTQLFASISPPHATTPQTFGRSKFNSAAYGKKPWFNPQPHLVTQMKGVRHNAARAVIWSRCSQSLYPWTVRGPCRCVVMTRAREVDGRSCCFYLSCSDYRLFSLVWNQINKWQSIALPPTSQWWSGKINPVVLRKEVTRVVLVSQRRLGGTTPSPVPPRSSRINIGPGTFYLLPKWQGSHEIAGLSHQRWWKDVFGLLNRWAVSCDWDIRNSTQSFVLDMESSASVHEEQLASVIFCARTDWTTGAG